jgi:hypothetical protein
MIQIFEGTRREKTAAGVKIGMSTGMTAHHSRGFAVKKAAATSMAHTKHRRIAILSAHERVDSIRMEISPPKSSVYVTAIPFRQWSEKR